MKILLYRGIGGFTVSEKALKCLGITTQLGLEINEEQFLYFFYVGDFYPEQWKELHRKFGDDSDKFMKKVNELKIKMRADSRLIDCWKRLGKEFPGRKEDYENYELIEIPDDIDGLAIREYETGYEYVVDTNSVY